MSSVPKSKRNEKVEYQVISFMNKIYMNIVNQLLIDFGFSEIKENEKIEKLKEANKNLSPERLDERIKKNKAFTDWYIVKQRDTILSLLTETSGLLREANGIFPTNMDEYNMRLTHLRDARTKLYRLTGVLQNTIHVLPVDINKYTQLALDIDKEINLIKGAEKSDQKRFKKILLNNEAQQQASIYMKICRFLSKPEDIEDTH